MRNFIMKNEPMLTKNRNLLKNQLRITNLFIHSVSSSFGMVMLLATFLILATKIPCLAADYVDATEDSWLRTGLFCFRSGIGTNTQIHLARYENGKFEELFTKVIGHSVKCPICFTNGVVVVSSDGVIRKLDLTGQFVFVSKPKGFEGLSGATGRLDDNRIFMTETTPYKQNNGWLNRYRLYVVDISGAEPTLKEEFNIIPPLRITRTIEEIVVIGETNILRVKIPEGLRQVR
jgi:hypothetical protein